MEPLPAFYVGNRSTLLGTAISYEVEAVIGLDMAVPQVPVLLFLSDGSGGTGFDTETWRSIPKEYLSRFPDGKYIELDCPHYVHNYEYLKISTEIKSFLDSIK